MPNTDTRSDVKDTVRQAGAALGQSTRDLAGTVRDQAGPVSEAVSAAVQSAVSSASTTAAERGRRAQKHARKRAEELQKQAVKNARKNSKKARKNAGKKAQELVDRAAEKTGQKPKRGKGKTLVLLGGFALAAYGAVTLRKKKAQTAPSTYGSSVPEPGAPSVGNDGTGIPPNA